MCRCSTRYTAPVLWYSVLSPCSSSFSKWLAHFYAVFIIANGRIFYSIDADGGHQLAIFAVIAIAYSKAILIMNLYHQFAGCIVQVGIAVGATLFVFS